MDVLLTIGEFSKMTYLSVKALRHYHDLGLLTPVVVDSTTGYRRYASSQVATAQAIRRFRDLDMPLEEVRRVLGAGDIDERNRIILVHLQRMQMQLERTQSSIASLQALLADAARVPAPIELRSVDATPALMRRHTVSFEECANWLEEALAELHAAAGRRALTVVGPDGALYPDEFFESGSAEVTAFLPIAGRGPGIERLDAATVAVLVHDGPLADVDQTYGALGTAVAERGIGAPGAIREHYLTPARTEVCWPVRADALA